MFSKEEREERKILLRDSRHFFSKLHERGINLFSNISPKEMLAQSFEAIKDPNRSIIVKDGRGKDSTHHCIFVSDSGGYVCIPCVINDGDIFLITIKDVRKDESPLWYVRNYNVIAEQRGLMRMNAYDCDKIKTGEVL